MVVYAPSDLLASCPPLPPSTQGGVDTTSEAIVVDASRQPDPILIESLLKRSRRFQSTWERQRPDLKDQSQSVYDLAVMVQVLRSGLSDQDAVDFAIAHRVAGGESPKRHDYYVRTLAKAKAGGRAGSSRKRKAGRVVSRATAARTPSPHRTAPDPVRNVAEGMDLADQLAAGRCAEDLVVVDMEVPTTAGLTAPATETGNAERMGEQEDLRIEIERVCPQGRATVHVYHLDNLVYSDQVEVASVRSREQFLERLAAYVSTIDPDTLPEIEAQLLEAYRARTSGEDQSSNADEHLTVARDRDADRAHVPLPEILIGGRQLRHVVDDAWGAVLAQGTQRMPAVFVRDGSSVCLGMRSTGPSIRVITVDCMAGLLARAANWFQLGAEGDVPDFPPLRAARDMVELPRSDLQPLEAIVSAPILSRDGSLLTVPGYYAADRVILHEPLGIGAVPDAPTIDDVAAARQLLDQELLIDFPFSSKSDRTHAVCAAITPLVRRMMPESTSPFFSFEAATPGAGKGKLAQAMFAPSCGTGIRMRSFPKNDEELHKYITSVLIEAPAVVVLDNAAQGRVIDSPELAALLTTATWNDRVLGVSKLVSCPNQAAWSMTANNPRFSMELARRTVRIRLDPRHERPWERTGFRHTLPHWALEHRADLLRALLILVRHWIHRGQPKPRLELGSFERWSQIVGGIVTAAGYEGFLADRDAVYATADSEASEFRDFVGVWWSTYGGAPQGVATLLRMCREHELLSDVIGDGPDRSQSTRIGRALSTHRERIYGGLRIELARDDGHRGKQYRLVQAASKAGDVGNLPGTTSPQRSRLVSIDMTKTYNGSGDVGNVGNLKPTHASGEASPPVERDPAAAAQGQVPPSGSQEAAAGSPRPPRSPKATKPDAAAGPEGDVAPGNVPSTFPTPPVPDGTDGPGSDLTLRRDLPAAEDAVERALSSGSVAAIHLSTVALSRLIGPGRAQATAADVLREFGERAEVVLGAEDGRAESVAAERSLVAVAIDPGWSLAAEFEMSP